VISKDLAEEVLTAARSLAPDAPWALAEADLMCEGPGACIGTVVWELQSLGIALPTDLREAIDSEVYGTPTDETDWRGSTEAEWIRQGLSGLPRAAELATTAA